VATANKSPWEGVRVVQKKSNVSFSPRGISQQFIFDFDQILKSFRSSLQKLIENAIKKLFHSFALLSG